MSSLAMDTDHPIAADERFIGNIPVRNLWLLMLYASDLYRQLGHEKISIEENPEQIADLVAEILCHQVDRRLMRNLSFGYEGKIAVISRVRGRIDTLYTERHRLLDRGKVCCRFEELTVDTPRNRYVRAALEALSKIVMRKELGHRCQSLSMSLQRLGVSQGRPHGYSASTERFGRHDTEDKNMITAADLAFSLALPTENTGMHHLSIPAKEKHWLRKLFEKGIAGFYSVALENTDWDVYAGRQCNWQIDGKSDGVDAILPSMKTDIILENPGNDRRIVIDTKFNAITTKGWHRDQTLRSGYIYQMYAYLRTQEYVDDRMSINSTGMLLHPSIGVDVDESVTTQGHRLRFCTVNLGDSVARIRDQLLKLVDLD